MPPDVAVLFARRDSVYKTMPGVEVHGLADVVEHARNVGRNFALMRAAVGMRRKWRAPSGRLLPPPVLQEERQQ